MSRFVSIAKVGSIPEGEGATLVVGDRLIALFNHGGEYFAIDDACPHMGASLGAGGVDEDRTVACPWHAWRFRVTDGAWCDNPQIRVDAFEVRVVGDDIQVSLDPTAQNEQTQSDQTQKGQAKEAPTHDDEAC